MKKMYIYKKYNHRESNKLYKVIEGTTVHEVWRKLMYEEGLRNLTLAKTKFSMYKEPKPIVPNKPKVLEVNLKAFTEMYIGTYKAKAKKGGYIITLKDGRNMEFDSTGKQVNLDPGKERFANRIEWRQ